MKAFKYDNNSKKYLKEVECQLDQMETAIQGKNIYLLPADCTFTKPLENKEGYEIKWNGDKWYYEEIPKEPEPSEPSEPTQDELNQMEAEKMRFNLQNKALNSMMLILNGSGELATLQTEYQDELNSVSNDVALYMVNMFPVWNPNSVEYKKGERVSYNDILYQVVTAHTSQESWKPDVSPSLFVKVISSISGEIPEWEQPLPTNAYKKGDKVRCEGRIYESLIDNNVWKPTEYPAGWKDITDEIEQK